MGESRTVEQYVFDTLWHCAPVALWVGLGCMGHAHNKPHFTELTLGSASELGSETEACKQMQYASCGSKPTG